MRKKSLKPKLTTLIALTLFLTFAFRVTEAVTAYFNRLITSKVTPQLKVDILFGRLDESIATGEWGTDTNPYLIETTEHLINLYVLQNGSERFIIDENSVFQVSDPFGNPNYVGGPSANSPFNMQSIGTEEYPFVSKFRGVTTTDPTKFITLPTGEKTDTSALGNLKINAKPGQIDIGLFGNAGPTGAAAEALQPNQYVGSISNLLLYNIQVNTTSQGSYVAEHKYNVRSTPYETNHMGILVGHAQFVSIEKISVYYSSTNNVAHVNAFDVQAGSAAKYTTSGGIIGFYNKVVIDGNLEVPVSSDGSSDGLGNTQVGLGLGIVYAEDIWTFMENNTTVGKPAPLDSYNLKDTFGQELYGANNPDEKYFQVGVFTFAHSKEARGKDRLARIWSTSGSNSWTIATNGTAGYGTTNVNMGAATKYVATRITKAQTETDTYANGDIGYEYRHPDYRYMVVYESGGEQYALMRYGATAIGQKIETNNLVIPDGELEFYTFETMTQRSADTAYPPYESGWAYRYHTTGVLQFKRGTRTSPTNRLQYAVYGKVIYDGGVIREAPRPLRINAQNIQTTTPTTSFMASAGSTFVEGIRIAPVTTGNFSQYYLQRTGASGRGNPSSWWTTFTPEAGFSAINYEQGATAFSLYAVRVANDYWDPTNDPTPTNYYLQERQPLGDAPKKTYNTEENVLFYTGTPNSTTPSTRYAYDVRSIESLGWSDNNGDTITKGSTALMMADPTSYYFISNRFWGVTQDIPSPSGTGTIKVPEGSIGFTVNGTNEIGTTAKVFVIVATDPHQGIDQLITISRFGSGNNQDDDRQVLSSFVLPPAPAIPGVGSSPIYLNDNGTNYTAFTNFNTLLVAYIFEVPSRYNTTYFLEASRGSARFVYLSSERTAASDNNPLHENDATIPPLAGVDYVELGTTDPTRIATIGSPEYVSSLTMPYFGFKSNPNYVEGNPLSDKYVITPVTAYNFTYTISRAYNPTEQKHYLYINVNVAGFSNPITLANLKIVQQNMNFNYSEWAYLDAVNYRYIYSDVVVLNINGYHLYDFRVLD